MSEPAGRAFWLCHECGAQMRPIRIDGVRQCASCNSEFIEILDPDVNPDPAYELPPAPPVRPFDNPPTPRSRTQTAPASQGASITGMLGGLLNGLLGGGDDQYQNQQQQPHPHAGQQDTQARQDDSPFGRTYQFNIGGGSGSVTFGTFGGGGPGRTLGGGGPGPGPIPGQGGDQGGGLDAFFPGFPPPPPGRVDRHPRDGPRPRQLPGQVQPVAMQGGDLFRILMNVLGDEGILQGQPGLANLGDYATSDQGFAQIMEQLMQAAGPQGPIPATDAVIEGLPRLKLDAESIEKSTFKDCPVCKDDYVPGDEVMRVPCQHTFHVDCLQPWLKTNGSCPVCRFSLIPADDNRAETNPAPPPGQSTTGPESAPGPGPSGSGPSGITNILHRLWGQSGSASQPTSPTTENPPDTRAGSSGQRLYDPPATPPPGATAEAEEMYYTHPNSLPPGMQDQDTDSRGGHEEVPPIRDSASARRRRYFDDSPDTAIERAFNPSPETLEAERQVRERDEAEITAARARARAAGGVVNERFPTSIPNDYRERHRQREIEQNRQRELEQSQQRDRDPYLDDLD